MGEGEILSELRRACQTGRTRWRLRLRSASRFDLPSARLRAKKAWGVWMDAGLGHRDPVNGTVELAVAASRVAVPAETMHRTALASLNDEFAEVIETDAAIERLD